MKNNQPVTAIERPMKAGTILVSQTNLKGEIQSCNQNFVDVSGYSVEELLGSHHNIVRHPSMPAVMFKSLWQTVQGGVSGAVWLKTVVKTEITIGLWRM